MSKIINTTLALTIVVSTTGAAFADAAHHVDGKDGSEVTAVQGSEGMGADAGPMNMMGQGSMMQGNHHEMMQDMMKMMMKMHGGMMGAGMGQMGADGQMGMMDQDMMSLMRGPMMGQFNSDADGDGTISGDEAHGQLQSMHTNADTNGDGALTLEEFEVLHSEMIRSMMVDRFQHLDTDGDGMVTTGEMVAPADRMNMRAPSENMMGDKVDAQDN